jgi:flagellar protein FliS
MGQRYRQMDIATATPESLVGRLLAASLEQGRRARAELGAGVVAERCRALSRCVAIVAELRSSLDMERGGEIAANLHRLYDFAIERLLEANLRSSPGPLDEALRVLEILAEAWAEMLRARGAPARKAS